jgi:hypothetical protein
MEGIPEEIESRKSFFSNLRLKKLVFSLNRKTFYIGLLSSALLPHIFSEPKWSTFILLSCGIIMGGLLITIWEKKMQGSVAALVKIKCQTTFGEQSSKALQYEAQIARLNAALEESRREYEHQIDLLQTSASKAKERVEELNIGMDRKLEEVRHAYLEYEDVRKEYRRLQDDLQKMQIESEEQLRNKETLLHEYQHTIQEQRTIIEKKQRYIFKLEEKVRDLMYEIRSLLQLENSSQVGHSAFIETPEQKEELSKYYLPATPKNSVATFDLSLQLQKYIETAENFTGAEHLGFVGGKAPRFSYDGYAIDLRRLFDAYRDERGVIIFIYSQIEERLLFVNNHIKSVLEISPERFVKELQEIMIGSREWQSTLASMTSAKKEEKMLIACRSKQGQEIAMHSQMGLISKGPFVDHVIGLLVPVK